MRERVRMGARKRGIEERERKGASEEREQEREQASKRGKEARKGAREGATKGARM